MDSFLDRLRKALMEQEGRVPRSLARDHLAYKDSGNIWTTGYGFNLQDKNADKELAQVTKKTAKDLIAHKSFLNEDEALKLLDIRIQVAISDARGLVTGYDALAPPRQLVLACMAYQLGRSKMSAFKGMLGALGSGDFEGAAKHMVNSRWGHQTTDRVQMLADALRTAQYPDMSSVGAPRRRSRPARRGSARHIPPENRARMEKEGRALALQRDLLHSWNNVTSTLTNEVIQIAEYWQNVYERHQQALRDEARRREIAEMTRAMSDLQAQANALYSKFIKTVQEINEAQSRQSILAAIQVVMGLVQSGISAASLMGFGSQAVTSQGPPENSVSDDVHYSSGRSLELNGVRITETYEINGSREAIRNLNEQLLKLYPANNIPLEGPPPPPPNNIPMDGLPHR